MIHKMIWGSVAAHMTADLNQLYLVSCQCSCNLPSPLYGLVLQIRPLAKFLSILYYTLKQSMLKSCGGIRDGLKYWNVMESAAELRPTASPLRSSFESLRIRDSPVDTDALLRECTTPQTPSRAVGAGCGESLSRWKRLLLSPHSWPLQYFTRSRTDKEQSGHLPTPDPHGMQFSQTWWRALLLWSWSHMNCI